MPSARRKAFFAYFLSPFGQKVRRLAGRDPPVIILKDKEGSRLTNCCPLYLNFASCLRRLIEAPFC